MSKYDCLVKGKFYLDQLTKEQGVHRQRIYRVIQHQVAKGAHPHSIFLVFVDHVEKRDPMTTLDQLVKELPGKWVVLSESWQGLQRNHFHMKVVYYDEEAVCLLDGDALLGDSEVEVDSIWMSHDEANFIAYAVNA